MIYEKEITMTKKKNKLGKFIAFTTTAAAIGGICYIFHDRIKKSTIYQTILSKVSNYFDTSSEKFSDTDDEVDFADAFPENAEHGREYTSITINAREAATATDSSTSSKSDINNETKESTAKETSSEKKDSIFSDDSLIEIFPKDYENNGLSDTSEDPDTLEEQDKLDF